MSEIEESVDQAFDKLSEHIQNHGKPLAIEAAKNCELLLIWLSYLHSSKSQQHSLILLDRVKYATVEAAACISFGLIRPALGAMRLQLELLLAWSYFNDHLVEFRKADKKVEDFPLRATYLKYLHSYGEGFQKKLAILRANKTGNLDDPYGLLSIHVHATSPVAIPPVTSFKDLIGNYDRCEDLLTAQNEVAEYLSDVLTVWFFESWTDIPKAIQESVKKRLSAAQLKEVFSVSG